MRLVVTKLAKVLKLTLASSSVAGGDGGGSDIENSGHVDVVPLFLCEGVSAKYQYRLILLQWWCGRTISKKDI